MSSAPHHENSHARVRRLIVSTFLSTLLIGGISPAGHGADAPAKPTADTPTKTKTASTKTAETKEKAKPITSAEKSKRKDQIRRLLQNSRIPQARGWAKKAIKRWEEHKDPKHNDLLAYACWAMSVLSGNDGDDKKCIEFFDRALEAGWSNPFTFKYASLIPQEIRNSEDYGSRVRRLEEAFSAQQGKELAARLEKSLHTPLGALQLPTDNGGGTLEATALAGRPLLVVLTRLQQPGFDKMVPALTTASEKFGEILPVVVLFYQYFADDASRRKETLAHVERAGMSWPFAIVDRSFVADLNLDYLPATFLIDDKGQVLFQELGTLTPGFLTQLFETAIAATGARAPEPPTTTNPEDDDAPEDSGAHAAAENKGTETPPPAETTPAEEAQDSESGGGSDPEEGDKSKSGGSTDAPPAEDEPAEQCEETSTDS